MISALRGEQGRVEPWAPTLSVLETEGGCRLSLGGFAVGTGGTLQEAADQLVSRVLDTALALRARGVSHTPALPVDLRVVEFLSDVADVSVRGGDVRRRVLE